ncbi:site-2 protease family protein [Streptomyces sp. NPDC052077]|uniref:site-2 protease family protein n=1 Tax=Streptomyces sp. NPDC052077 TaxID=3154757 RepID=UPI00343C9DAE
MDVSGGSGQPRSGKDEPAEPEATPAAPAAGAGPAGRPPEGAPSGPDAGPATPDNAPGGPSGTPADGAGETAPGGPADTAPADRPDHATSGGTPHGPPAPPPGSDDGGSGTPGEGHGDDDGPARDGGDRARDGEHPAPAPDVDESRGGGPGGGETPAPGGGRSHDGDPAPHGARPGHAPAADALRTPAHGDGDRAGHGHRAPTSHDGGGTPARDGGHAPHDTHPRHAHAAGGEAPAPHGGGAAPAHDGGDRDRRGDDHAGDTHPRHAHADSGGHGAPHHPAHPPSAHVTGRPAAGTDPDHERRSRAHAGGDAAPGSGPRRRREPGGGLLMGRPFGVPVYVAPSWFLVAILITWVFGGQLDRVLPDLGAARYLVSLFFAVAFYASVLVHELAHTVAALRFKLPVRRIQLQFFGGVSEIEKEAETPGREFVLAFVGPLLSLVLAGVFYLALLPVDPGSVPGVLLAGLMISNLIVAAFNFLPGLPLDGGRMLRAVVWKITGKPMSGTVAAAWVGRALAVSVLIGLPLLTQSGALGAGAVDNVGMDTVMDALLAAILAAIIWTGAGNSLRMARLREHLPELRARALTRRAVPVPADTPLSEALRRANAAGARALVVVDADGGPVSLVREAAIVGVPEHRRPWVPVSGLAQDITEGMRLSAELTGEELLDALRASPATEYLVVEETGEIYGVLSAADVERAFVKAMARPS